MTNTESTSITVKQAAKHTAGPWITDGGTHVQSLYALTDGGKPFYHTIARTDRPLVSPEQQGANARLIAASPTMFDELKANRDMLIELRDKHLHGAAAVVRALVQKRIEAADAILTKAA